MVSKFSPAVFLEKLFCTILKVIEASAISFNLEQITSSNEESLNFSLLDEK